MRSARFEMLPSRCSFKGRLVHLTTGDVLWRSPCIVRRSDAAPNREEQMLSIMSDQSRWPRPADGDAEWHALWVTAMAETDEGSRRSRIRVGERHPALDAGAQWFGGLNLKQLVHDGCVLCKGVVPEAVCKELENYIRGSASGTARVTHGVTDAEAKSCSKFFQLPPELGGAKDVEEGVKVPRGRPAEAMAKLAQVVSQAAGKAGRNVPGQMEGIYPQPGKTRRPQKFHGDFKGPPSLAAVVMLSEQGPGPYFVSLAERVGLTQEAAVEMADRGMAAGGYPAAREARWRCVEASGCNEGWLLGSSATGSVGATRRSSVAGADRRETQRPLLRRGDVVFFDSTAPHCGPGVTQAEIAMQRTVLYLNWAGSRALGAQGAPCYAFPPQSVGEDSVVEGRAYQLVFKEGEYQLTVAGKQKGAKYPQKRKFESTCT